jgi:hypothetical protein
MTGARLRALSARRRPAEILNKVVPAVLTLMLMAGYLAYIHTYGVNLPFWDEWSLGEYMLRQQRDELTLLELLTAKHNEHLMGVSFALMLLHHLATGYDTKAILYLSAALQFASLGLLLMLASPLLPQSPRRGWHALLIWLMMLSLAPAWNILWGFQTAWYLITFFLLACLWFLSLATRTGRSFNGSAMAAAALCAGLASFCSIHGLAVWLAGGAYLYMSIGGGLRALRNRHFVIWTGLAIAVFALHAWITALTPTPHAPSRDAIASMLANPLDAGRFILAMMSTVWGDRLGAMALPAGTLIALLCLTGLVLALAPRQGGRFAMPAALMVFGLVFALMVTVGRLRLGQAAAIESRYSNYLLLAVVGSYLTIMFVTENERGRPAFAAARMVIVSLVVIAFVSAAIFGLKTGRAWRVDRGVGALILLNAESEPRFKIERTICWSAEIVLRQVPWLRSASLSTFGQGSDAIPRQAAVYARPTTSYQRLLDNRPEDRKALIRLWDVYVVGPDLRRAFPPTSPTMPTDLIRWAADSARGQHYLSRQLLDFAQDYERLRKELASASATRPLADPGIAVGDPLVDATDRSRLRMEGRGRRSARKVLLHAGWHATAAPLVM